MSKSRIHLIKQAYAKFDCTGDGQVTIKDIRMKYKATDHPKYKSGDWTQEKVFHEFLCRFEPDDSQSKGDGIVSPVS